ncbi:MAG: VanZ family protein [Oscillospiraceae bacterium]
MKYKIEVVICSILILLTVAFVWNNSAKTIPESMNDTNIAAKVVEKIADKVDRTDKKKFESYNSFLKYLRKCAHAIEFFSLGAEIAAFSLIIRKKFKPQNLWNILSSVLAIAVVDEAIQIFSGRGPAVQDVILDFCGALVGVLLVLLIGFIIASLKGRKKYAKA